MKKITLLLMLLISLAGYSQKPMFVEAFSRQQDSTLDKLYSICRADSAILVVNHYDPNDTLTTVFTMDRMTYLHCFCVPSYVVGGYTITDSLGSNWRAYNDMNNRYLTEVTCIQASLTTFTFGGVYRLKLNLSETDPSWSYNIFIIEDFNFFKCVQRSYAKIPATGIVNVDIIWRNNWTLNHCRIVVEVENNNHHTIAVRQVTIKETLNPSGTGDVLMPQISIYPNPCTDILNIESDQLISNLKITSLTGQVLYDNRTINDYTMQYPTVDLPKGLYFVQTQAKTYRIIKQ